MAKKDTEPQYTPESSLSPEFVTLLKNVTAKRAKCVIDHILKYGFITTEDLKNTYGYHHPPRAARDVREQGIPLENFPVKDFDGRSITAYKFADLSKIEQFKLGGRQVFSKLTRTSLYERQQGRCGVCHQAYQDRYLQVDHRVPYEVAGDVADESDLDEFMSICASCQRSKSWTCEHCSNWSKNKNPDLCKSCYWGSPDGYVHIALEEVRREVLVWQGRPDIQQYERILKEARNAKLRVADYIKTILPNRS